MQTRLAPDTLNTPEGREAEQILRSCVHCGFCNATCPTYQLLGDELDGPRGRIYLIKQMLEGRPVTGRTRLHLDRCLTCRNCETTCPSGVRYGRLADIGRHMVEQRAPRGLAQRAVRRLLRMIIPHPARFGALLGIGRLLRAALPGPLRRAVPVARPAGTWPVARHRRQMLVLDGCAQPAIAPNINAATARVLDRLGISLVRIAAAGCCGAVSQHLNAQAEARDYMRRNIDAWWPRIEAGAEAIVMTASGCGVMVKDYATLLADDPRYAARAERVAGLTRDIAEVLANEDLTPLAATAAPVGEVAFHSPCTLQHGQRITGVVESILQRSGYRLSAVADAHLCCGSAGTYSLLQPRLARRLRAAKLKALEAGDPQLIVTANIGCLAHLQAGTGRPVRHWIELLDDVS